MRGRLLCVSAAALVLALAAAPSEAQVFVFHLSGDQEVPPVAIPSRGACRAELSGSSLSFACSHDVVGATVIHVHRGAAGVNGPVAFDLGTPESPVTATWTGMTAADVSQLLAGDLYLNIHTDGRPEGAIRGQILERTWDSLAFPMDGDQQVPPDGSSATGSCLADLDDAATGVFVECTHDVSAPTVAHVHNAPFGQNGPAIFDFPSAASPFSATAPLTPVEVAELVAGFLYVNVHSATSTEGEIRGQIAEPVAAPTTGTIRVVKRTFPVGGTGFGFTDDVPGSPGTFTLDDGESQSFFDVAPGTYSITEDDPSGGGFALGRIVCADGDSTGNRFTRTATVTLAAGELVTCTFENVESDTGDPFVFHLSGDQEVPPVGGTARGGCRATFDAVAAELTLVCVHDVVGPTLMHVHRAPAGANGPVVFDLGDPESPVLATWTGMTPADVADLLAGNLYVNVHTAGRPEGEIRGQIVERTFDTLAFPLDGDQQVPPDGSSATGSCFADLDDPASSLFVECTHDVANPTDAHVHSAPFGQNGPVVFVFPSATSPFSGDAPLSPVAVAELVAGFLYVNVHSVESPTGEIRGQIAELPAAPTTGEIRIVKRTFPGGGTGFGFTDDVPGSPGVFTLDDGQTEVFAAVPAGTYTFTEDDPTAAGYALAHVACSDAGDDSSGNRFARTATVALAAGEVVVCTFENQELAAGTPFVFHLSGDQEVPPLPNTATGGCMATFDAGAAELTFVCVHDVVGPTMIHVHRGAAGENGPVVFDLGVPDSPVLATWTGMTPADVADLLAGRLYLNIHTGGRPAGAIRGQIVPRSRDGFDFPLSGDQQVPPVETPASGRCFADLSDAADELFVRCEHTVADATAAHVHQGPAGTNGPVRFHLGSPASPFTLVSPMAPRDVADLMAGFLYVNVHSEALPDGEIRGQIVHQPAALAEIPTLGEWGMALLALALALLGAAKLAVRR